MPKLPISHHERVEGHSHRWRVFLHGCDEPVPVDLPAEEREKLDLDDEEIHTLVPEALQRHYDGMSPDAAPGEAYAEADWDAPVRLMQTHFIA
jgi:hypothetical protein